MERNPEEPAIEPFVGFNAVRCPPLGIENDEFRQTVRRRGQKTKRLGIDQTERVRRHRSETKRRGESSLNLGGSRIANEVGRDVQLSRALSNRPAIVKKQ